MSLSSIEVSPNSFSMMAIFLPCVAVRMWLSRVVLPEPRKPVRMVTGTRSHSIAVRGKFASEGVRKRTRGARRDRTESLILREWNAGTETGY